MTKIKAISDFITKITRKNILFIATILFINYQLIATWSNIPINKFSFNMYLSVKIYTLITLCSLIILNILFYMKKNYDVIKVLCENDFEYFLGVVIALIRNNFIYSCIPLIYMGVYSIKVRVLDLVTIKSTISILIFEWFLPLSIISVIVAFIVVLFKNIILKVSICSFLIYITLKIMENQNEIKGGNFFHSIYKSLSIFEDQPYNYYSDYVGKVFNISTVIDKLVIIIFAATIIFIAYIILMNKSKKYIKSTLIAFIFLGLFVCLNKFSASTTTYLPLYSKPSYAKELKYKDLNNFHIESHNIDAKFASKSYIKDKIKIKNTSNKNQDEVSFILDKLFNIESIEIGNKNLEFERDGSLVIIKLDNSVTSGQSIYLDVNYSGYIDIQNSRNEYKYLATRNDLLLGYGEFIWYPIIDTSSNVYFEVNVNMNSNVYSNIEKSIKEKNLFLSTYKFKGHAKVLELYAGEYKSTFIKNIKGLGDVEVIHPADCNAKRVIEFWYSEILKSFLEDKDLLNNVEEIKEINKAISEGKIKKIIIAPTIEIEKNYKLDDMNCSVILGQILNGNTITISNFGY